MDIDDPRQPLLGCPPKNKWRDAADRLCNLESWKRRMPITIWLPNYSFNYLLRDAIAGITVGLTSIPQGIAYAILAGLPPQIGLYSSIFPGIVYAIFGSCKDVTVGPTAILAALLAKYVAQSPDFAFLAAFLSGFVILLLGILQLGFLLDFISKPVISGFTTAAALQISASQLKSLFRVSGGSGGTFVKSIVNFFKNIRTIQLWDTLLGIVTIIALLLLQRSTIKTRETDSRRRTLFAKSWLYVVRARNALVVFFGIFLAYVLYLYGITPFAITGTIKGGLPNFRSPFSVHVGNKTLNFQEMLEAFGPEGLTMPLVAILESIAIAKAFAGGRAVDATQEMLAVGVCNVASSFAQAMPATGSFTRTALNHASGVATPAGCLFKAATVLLAVTLLAEAFYFIPRATLAAIIMVAMASLVDLSIVAKLWISSKWELVAWLLTVVVGAGVGLEYGIAAGACADAARALAAAARPPLDVDRFKAGALAVSRVRPRGPLSYASAEHVSRVLRRAGSATLVVLDAGWVRRVDIGVAENLITAIEELETQKCRVILWNFDAKHQRLFQSLQPKMAEKFSSGTDIHAYILSLNYRSDSTLAL